MSITHGKNKIISLTRNDGRLVRYSNGSKPVYLLSRDIGNKTYEAMFEVSSTTGEVIRHGVIVYDRKLRLAEVCEPSSLEKATQELKKLSEHINEENTQVAVSKSDENSCKKLIGTRREEALHADVESLFYTEDSYLSQCMNSSNVKSRVAEQSELLSALTAASEKASLDKILLEKGNRPLNLQCKAASVSSAGIAAAGSYDESSGAISVYIKDGKISVGECQSAPSILFHEFVHRAGVKDEGQVRQLTALCADVNKQDFMKKSSCREDLSAGKDCKTGDCNKMALAKETLQEVSKAENLNQAEKTQEAIKDKGISKVKVIETVKAGNSQVDLQNLAKTDSGAPTSEVALSAVSTAMNNNYSQFSGLIESAVASTGTSPALTGTGTRSRGSSNPETSSVAESNRSRSRSSSGKLRIAQAGNRQGIGTNNYSDKYTDEYTDEYIAEEIIATKLGIPGNETALAARTQLAQAGSANSPGLVDLNQTGTGGGGGVASAAPKISVAGRSSTRSSAGSGAGASSGANPGSGQVRNTASIAPAAAYRPELQAFANSEILGGEYKTIRGRYTQSDFLKAMQEENIRILLLKQKKTVGSAKKDATIFVDTGTSLVKRK